jgi:hypothetical protein
MRRLLLVAAAVGLTACGNKPMPVEPVAGELTLTFSSPVGNDGALLLLVSGGPVTTVTALNGYQAASAPAGTNLTRIVVTGNLVAGDVVKIAIPDTSASAAYSARVEAAANRNTFALSDPLSYTAGLRK